MKTFSTKDQLKILEWAKDNYSYFMQFGVDSGLCWHIRTAIVQFFYIKSLSYNRLRFCIPLFTKKNAQKFGGKTKTGYWWGMKDLNRGLFLDWMIDELKRKENEEATIKSST